MSRVLGTEARAPIAPADIEVLPLKGNVRTVFTTGEVTAVCPVTGQRDFYGVQITYGPCPVTLESKALKLYLASFTDHAIFCENLAVRIATELATVLGEWVAVEIRQNVRGGLALEAAVEAVP